MKVWEERLASNALKTIQPHLTAEAELANIEIGARARLPRDDELSIAYRSWLAHGQKPPRPLG